MDTCAFISRNSYRQLWLFLTLLLGLLGIVASGDGGGDGPGGDEGGGTPAPVTVTGIVRSGGGLPGVSVMAGGRSTVTDDGGFYELSGVPVPDNDGRLVLTYEKAGYATAQRVLPVVAGESYTVAADLLPYHQVSTIDAANANDISVPDPADMGGPPLAELSIPAGSLAASGMVTVSVAVGDPTTAEGRAVFPGDFMAADSSGDPADTPLESIVFTEITVTDAGDNELTQLGQPATVSVRLPDSLQVLYAAGDTIPWWSYDETAATWVREDADPDTPELDDAQVIDLNGDGVLYAQARVTHLTWWNVDKPITQHACLCVNVVDENEVPVPRSLVYAEGVTYNGVSAPASSDQDGQACVTVKRSMGSEPERVRLYVESGTVRAYYDVTDPEFGDVDRDEVFTPTTQGSTINNSGQCMALVDPLLRFFDGEVIGTVTYEASGSPVPNFTLYSSAGGQAVTDADGRYRLKIPARTPVSLYSVGLVSQTVEVNQPGTPVTADFVIPNRAPQITALGRSPEGGVSTGDSVTLTVSASDADGDALTYAWSATAGSLNRTDGASVVWVAPASGSGTAEVTVVVSDPAGAQASQSVTIVYTQPAQSATRLSILVKDSLRGNQPVSGVTVALYDTDDRTIARTLTSDATGLADFGDIGRSRATVTIAYDLGGGMRYIDTYVDVPVGENLLYYMDEMDGGDGAAGVPIAQVDLSLTNLPADAGPTYILPMLAYWSPALDPVILNGTPVAATDLQDDGKLSLLALTHSSIDASTMISYGYLLDQTLTDGASYSIPLGTSPFNLGWSTNPTANLGLLTIQAMRRGVEYLLAMPQMPQASSGTLAVAGDFPGDYFTVEAIEYASGFERYTNERHDTLPQTVQVNLPDYDLSAFSFDAATGTYSWQVTGSTPTDFVMLSLAVYDDSTQTSTEWNVYLPADATSWRLVELPAPADTWIDVTSRTQLGIYDSVLLCDLDLATSRDELWQFITAGGDMNSAQYMRCGMRSLGAQGFAVASKAMADGNAVPGSLRKELLRHLRRR